MAAGAGWAKVLQQFGEGSRGGSVEKNLYRFILKYSLRQQVIIVLLSIASFIPYYYYLSMPKAIVNQGIQGKDISFPVDLLGLGWVSLDHTSYLLVLCFGFLALVLVQQGFKYVINLFQGIAGERMLRRLRYLRGVLPPGLEVLFYLSRLPEGGSFDVASARGAVRAAAALLPPSSSSPPPPPLDEGALVALASRRAAAGPPARDDTQQHLHPEVRLAEPPPQHVAL